MMHLCSPEGLQIPNSIFHQLVAMGGICSRDTKLMYALWTNMAVASTCRCPVYTFILLVEGCHIYIPMRLQRRKPKLFYFPRMLVVDY
jgi:hypothetical protein